MSYSFIMVKGKPKPLASKGLSSKRTAAKVSSASPGPSVQIACKPQDVPSCCGCGSVITDDTKTLQCDRCASADSSGSVRNASISPIACMITWSQIAMSHLSGFVKVATRLSWIKGQKETD